MSKQSKSKKVCWKCNISNSREKLIQVEYLPFFKNGVKMKIMTQLCLRHLAVFRGPCNNNWNELEIFKDGIKKGEIR